ncbi:hypothetical protein OKW21_001312 [Catalinimonas alkaloidigena]|uniref:hypothetical protein n=1 Tax=Catalinimonas alkaloidigena TaxID=1075417 RepID=UPI002406D133|nr:hypothetical protein [Catalinimonas alkaloidigena]MDF9796049.1 hypothetical protein [Catalinimonas alkaloidigena]
MKNPEVKIYAGPDSLDDFNIEEVYKMAEIKSDDKPALYGARTVGLKSRTNFDMDNSDAGFMGYDFEAIMQNFNIFGKGGNADDLVPLPTVEMAEKIYKETGLIPSSEIMLPAIQLACIKKSFANDPFLVWNSAVDQLGWHIRQMAGFAEEHGWIVGLKNGKWLGEEYKKAESKDFKGKTSIETVWDGLVNYASIADEVILIQRGCDLPAKGEYRNLPIHYTATRTKRRHADKNVAAYFDPSHSLGPKMRDQIVEETVKAMRMKVSEDEYLYDGILIEVGTAKCDTHQHITVNELQELVEKIAEFRTLSGRRKHIKEEQNA